MIASGKLAGFTVFSKDIMETPEAEILTTRPVMTMISGEIVFDACKRMKGATRKAGRIYDKRPTPYGIGLVQFCTCMLMR